MRGGRAAEAAERARVAAKPCVLPHVERRLDPRHAAEGRAGRERAGLGDLARRRVDDRRRRPGPAGPRDPSRLVPDAAHDASPHGEPAAALAEAVVGHRRLAPRGARVPVLGARALGRRPVAGGLPADALPVGIGADGAPVRPLGERAVVGLAVRGRAGVLPPEAPRSAAAGTAVTLLRDTPGDAAVARPDGPDPSGLEMSLALVPFAMLKASFVLTPTWQDEGGGRRLPCEISTALHANT